MKLFFYNYILHIYVKYILVNNKDIEIFKDKYKNIGKYLISFLNINIIFYSIIFFPYFIGEMNIEKLNLKIKLN